MKNYEKLAYTYKHRRVLNYLAKNPYTTIIIVTAIF